MVLVGSEGALRLYKPRNLLTSDRTTLLKMEATCPMAHAAVVTPAGRDIPAVLVFTAHTPARACVQVLLRTCFQSHMCIRKNKSKSYYKYRFCKAC